MKINLSIIHFLYFSFALSFSACANSTADSNVVKVFSPTEQHKIIYQTAMQFVSSYHYAKPQIDDEFSKKALANYIETLDPAKVYFLQEDIQAFKKYENQLDDGIFNGNVEPAFDIFNVYQKRLTDRIQFAQSLLSRSFDFNTLDSFQTNREKAAFSQTYSDYDKLWQHKIKYECLVAKGGKTDSANKYLTDVKKRYDNLAKFSGKTKADDVLQLYMNAILETTDPHTNYFSPRNAEDFNQSMSLSLEGIGAQLQTENEYTQIREIIKGGPADRSKQLFSGDKIIGVAQGKDSDVVNVVDWRIDDVVSLIRGKKGTPVRLKVIPAKDPTTTQFIDLIRDKIALEDQAAKCTIKQSVQNGKKIKTGIITIPNFYIDFAAASRGEANYKSTTRDVKKLIDSLTSQKVDGLIIDLRNNGGGSLQEAIELTGLFIKNGPVVQVQYADGTKKIEADRDNGVYYNGPLVVMVNRFSASASEIFSAAIQDYNRGIVIGERTFGKGTVQNMVDLNEFISYNDKKLGQVKFTMAKFYRVTGGSTQHKGVTPDLLVPGLFDGGKYGEDASPYALPWDQIGAVSISEMNTVNALKNQLITKHKQRIQKEPEYIYLLEDIATIAEVEKEEYVSLNEQVYKADLEKENKLKKQREEARKKDRKDQSSKPDLLLEESEYVIGDILMLSPKKK
jgi:carboxyl-terminal processing protease